jgi:hypothetical protein
MNTNLNNDLTPDFDSLFEFSSDNQKIEHEARMIMYRFLSEIEAVSPKKRGLKKFLAESIGKSSSFITQLFNGDKLINLVTIAKFQKALNIKFDIRAKYLEDAVLVAHTCVSASKPTLAVSNTAENIEIPLKVAYKREHEEVA